MSHRISNIKRHLSRVTCTLVIVLGLLGLVPQASEAAAGAFTFSAASYSVNEGAGTVKVTINRAGGSTGAVTVNWRTNSLTATYNLDYTSFSWTTLSFAAGETQKIMSIKILNDTLIEPAETFQVSLASPTGGATLGSIVSSVITILDNDTAAADTAAPTVALSSPASGSNYTTAQTVTIAATASDNVGVSKVELYDGAALLGTDSAAPYSFAWAVSAANNGSHSFTAKAYDAANNSKASAAATVAVNIPVPDTTAPSVTLSSPLSGSSYTTAQSVALSATASDNLGVSKVEFYDGATLLASDSAAPYSFAWAVGTASNGSHSITAKAFDAAGNSKVSAAATVTVNIAPIVASGPLKVFPGAEGYGTDSVAGRGGQIIKVTNLNDSGAGSLRAALQASGPRIVVFEVSGYINLKTSLSISNPYVTIAGQSAPSPGICLRNWGITITSHDVLIQHLAIRPGNPANVTEGIEILGPSSNIVVDHCSLTWGIDENASTWYDNVSNFTFSNNLIAEGLMSHSMGLLLGAGFDNASVVRNVLAHNNGRNPRVQTGRTHDAHLVMVNNLIYNHYWDCASISAAYGNNDPVHINSLNNYIADGPQTKLNEAIYGFDANPGYTLYSSGDEHHPYASPYATGLVYTGSVSVKSAPIFSIAGYTALKTADVMNALLATAGARPADRDPNDQRILDSIKNLNGSWISSPADVGGYSVLSESYRTLTLPANPNGDDDRDGYTNIEEVLYQMAVQVTVK